MATLGIIGAMEEEIAILKESAEVVTAKNILGLDFFVATLFGKSVVLVKSGIGKVNAAVCTQVLIDHFAVDYIVNVGVAGAIFKDLKIGDIVISTDTVQHDMDTSATGDPVGVIPRMEESFFKADKELIEKAEKAGMESVDGAVYLGRIASGDKFIAQKEDKSMIGRLFNAYCVEMEGAAIAQACYLNKIPFVIIRSISDNADGAAGMNYAEFSKIAAENSAKIVKAFVKEL